MSRTIIHKNRSNVKKNQFFLATSQAIFFTIAAGSTTISTAANEMGMTWNKSSSHNDVLGVDRVECNNCDAYQGDTSCSTKLPILCLKKDGSPDPGVPHVGGSHAMPEDYYNGWGEGHIGLTFPVRGGELAGVEDANDICEVQFGTGYIMAEFHDGKRQSSGYGGWAWYAYGNINDSSRFWVNSNTTPANCWGNNPGGHTARTEAEILTLLLGNGDSGSCTQAELDAKFEEGHTSGYTAGTESCGTGNYPNPTYHFDPVKKTGILDLPSVDFQMLNPLSPRWSTQYDVWSATLELIPGTLYFQLTDIKDKEPSN